MDDQTLNIHLSTLCNALTDAVHDVILNLRWGASSKASDKDQAPEVSSSMGAEDEVVVWR